MVAAKNIFSAHRTDQIPIFMLLFSGRYIPDRYDLDLHNLLPVDNVFRVGSVCITRLLRTWLTFAGWDLCDKALAHQPSHHGDCKIFYNLPIYRDLSTIENLRVDRDLSDVCNH